MLCDTSPIVAILGKDQRKRQDCADVCSDLREPLLTTCHCLTEASYLLQNHSGWSAVKKLWDYLDNEILQLHELTRDDYRRMKVLMERYKDRPMDMADASLVAAAEALNQRTIFTLDSDFYIYRFRNTDTFQVIP